MKCDCEEFLPKGCGTTEKCIKNFWVFNNFNKSQLEELKRIGLRKSIKKGPLFLSKETLAMKCFLLKTEESNLAK